MGFTPEEKVKIRYHLGYMNVEESATFELGVPAAVETSFIIESAMDKVLVVAESKVRDHLATLDGIESQMVCDHDLLAVESVGDIKIRADEQEMLDKRYQRWQNALANILGVYPNPFDKRFAQGGLNAPVRH